MLSKLKAAVRCVKTNPPDLGFRLPVCVVLLSTPGDGGGGDGSSGSEESGNDGGVSTIPLAANHVKTTFDALRGLGIVGSSLIDEDENTHLDSLPEHRRNGVPRHREVRALVSASVANHIFTIIKTMSMCFIKVCFPPVEVCWSICTSIKLYCRLDLVVQHRYHRVPILQPYTQNNIGSSSQQPCTEIRGYKKWTDENNFLEPNPCGNFGHHQYRCWEETAAFDDQHNG